MQNTVFPVRSWQRISIVGLKHFFRQHNVLRKESGFKERVCFIIPKRMLVCCPLDFPFPSVGRFGDQRSPNYGAKFGWVLDCGPKIRPMQQGVPCIHFPRGISFRGFLLFRLRRVSRPQTILQFYKSSYKSAKWLSVFLARFSLLLAVVDSPCTKYRKAANHLTHWWIAPLFFLIAVRERSCSHVTVEIEIRRNSKNIA